MQKLNLPEFDYNVRKSDGKVWIFDVIRKKYIVITPEEWVRQHFVHYLINTLKYPKSLIRIEGGLVYNQLSKRSDIVVYNREAKPWMLVECKAPEYKINNQTIRQASVYNATLKAEYIAITNGLVHFCVHTDWQQNKTEIQKDFPAFE